jgi:hypothetical protein
MPKQPKKQTKSVLPVEAIIAQTAPEAFASARAEIEAVPASALAPGNLDMARAARTGLAVADTIEPLLPAMAVLADLDFRSIQNLRTYALAVLHAHDLATEGGSATAVLSVLLEEAVPLRELMLSSAEVLALAGYVSRERVVAIRSGQGHADTAADLQALGRLYRELWARVRDKVVVTRDQVERAVTLSAELNKALGVREIDDNPLVEPRNPRHLRAQAFTLFTHAYVECVRAVEYLRYHHGDSQAIVPSLYARRPRRPGNSEAADELLDPSSAVEPEPRPAPPLVSTTAADSLAAD